MHEKSKHVFSLLKDALSLVTSALLVSMGLVFTTQTGEVDILQSAAMFTGAIAFLKIIERAIS